MQGKPDHTPGREDAPGQQPDTPEQPIAPDDPGKGPGQDKPDKDEPDAA